MSKSILDLKQSAVEYAQALAQSFELADSFEDSLSSDLVTVTTRKRLRVGWSDFEDTLMSVDEARALRTETAGRTYDNTEIGELIVVSVSGTLSQIYATAPQYERDQARLAMLRDQQLELLDEITRARQGVYLARSQRAAMRLLAKATAKEQALAHVDALIIELEQRMEDKQ